MKPGNDLGRAGLRLSSLAHCQPKALIVPLSASESRTETTQRGGRAATAIIAFRQRPHRRFRAIRIQARGARNIKRTNPRN